MMLFTFEYLETGDSHPRRAFGSVAFGPTSC
jgi:hypothetical protein